MSATAAARLSSLRVSPVRAVLISIPMMLLTGLLISGGNAPQDPLMVAGLVLAWLGFNAAFIAMLVTGETYRFRSMLFISIALGMIIFFSTTVLSTRGSIAVNEDTFFSGETPFCHLVIPMIIVPALMTGTVIFPGSMLEGFAPIALMLVLWTAASLVVGRGWCSWACFYGGYDEACSRVARTARIKTIDKRWTLMPWAVLLVVVLTSAIALEPIYCGWLCPFKAVTEFAAVSSFTIFVQTVIFVSLFIGLVIVLPILTKKRIQCSLFCPLGALQSLTNKVNVFDIRVDKSKCTDCKACIRNCPSFAMDETSLAAGKTLLSCSKCGKCVDNCPKHAIDYHIKGTAVATRPNLARVLFIYAAYLVTIVLGGGILATAIYRLLKLITTGSLL